jgi:stage II sporulation protein D
MSQYGAKAMAELGYSFQEILNFYYTDITIR